MLLFKRILDFQKSEGGIFDKRGARRYPVGLKYPLKGKVTLVSRDGEGRILPPATSAPTDWGGQIVNLSSTGVNIRLHPAAIAAPGESCTLKLDLDHVLFEVNAEVANYRINPQYVNCGIALKFPDSYTRKAYQQLIEPVIIGCTLTAVSASGKQDLPGLVREEYRGESESTLRVWRDAAKTLMLFELQVYDYSVRGNAEMPGLQIGYRENPKAGKRGSSPAIPGSPMSADHQREVTQLFQFIVQNLAKGVPPDLRRFLELFAA